MVTIGGALSSSKGHPGPFCKPGFILAAWFVVCAQHPAPNLQ
jgi:hypothetical protein